MKRVTLFLNGATQGGRVVQCPPTLQELKELAEEVLGLPPVTHLFLRNGGEIDSESLIRDDEVLYCSTNGQFLEPVSTPQIVADNPEWILLNVGGKHFVTTRRTLVSKEPLSMLARMFSLEGRLWPAAVDKDGAFLIDRSARYFEPIINYLRHGQVVLERDCDPLGVLEEAKFYGIQSLVSLLEARIAEEPSEKTPLSRRDVIAIIAATSAESELRFQGVNLEGADLSHLDLRKINFKFTNLRGCRLSNANLSFCCFERADLSGANLESCILKGARLVCANLEGCTLRRCDMEAGAKFFTNLESANLKGAELDGSLMGGVSLRVATLKNANMQNCYLRQADLAGADLENCDLSGSDLQQANLRGANLKDARMDMMLTPLHMAQAIR
ncbi:BTB/POZ domain-containing protein KCTD9-like isoform X2 [Varroa jacobsoni]|nr:BTB/POZ domain-containing protein KCTD9-like isoform X2 [Varroa destructor]XP_022670292.1 BTB/POZ domain-containing protein KCTD9-like isoform X2 [Varroa destructor]XP_022670293.1 BTB/POZ domain-containing protein KCTD9-like isoform X2 [Varroa destructor]XP_022670295.1 BTB/POZ domain-containing protein KCTD9-like isoform X2 [Varroa destructor]XP_022670296.1 BTB/POZ domain-containing protein KCTD9-like isoform X2 [Varroa destructor]XP_022670297.1 BTB/POZ domain-containing protein KCTD9-like 